MPSTTVTAVPTDDQLIATLEASLAAARAELDEIEPRRAALAARVQSLTTTIAVYKGESLPEPEPATPARKRKPRAKRAASTVDVDTSGMTVREARAAKKAAREAAEAQAAASNGADASS